jgi:hypothetical protein
MGDVEKSVVLLMTGGAPAGKMVRSPEEWRREPGRRRLEWAGPPREWTAHDTLSSVLTPRANGASASRYMHQRAGARGGLGAAPELDGEDRIANRALPNPLPDAVP